MPNNFDFASVMSPWLKKLGIELEHETLLSFNKLGDALLADPLYKSVSKILQPEEIALKHFIDSLAPISKCKELFDCKTVFDIGSGGGFPLFPLAIVFKNIQFTAIDSRVKSTDFINRISDKLELTNINAQPGRIEELAHESDYRQKADLLVCRALASLPTLIEYAVPLTKVNGRCLFYKGPKISSELSDANNAFKELLIDSKKTSFFRITPPELPFERGFVIINKTAHTPRRYPRKNGIPASKPL